MRPSSIKKRQRYLEAATRLFLEQGYDNTGLDQLIAECGGSKLTLYSYFGDKQGLLKAVVEYLTQTIQTDLSFAGFGNESAQYQLEQFAIRYLDFIYNPDRIKLIRLVINQLSNIPEMVDFFLERTVQQSSHTLTEFFHQHQTELQTGDPRITSEQFLGALKGNQYFVTLLTDTMPTPEQHEIYARETVQVFLSH